MVLKIILVIFVLGVGISLLINQYNILNGEYPRIEVKYDPFRFEYLPTKPKQNFAWESASKTSSVDEKNIKVKFKEKIDLNSFVNRHNLQPSDLEKYKDLELYSVKIPTNYTAWSFSAKVATDSAVEYARVIPVYKIL